ncbi:response regulator transcription factor [Flavivirga eckloniae]|uniref:DNA-binding response regulator n=1 Tax=Flavivirga eckloniae TaxID=1803846 RepID=A0A2K9PJF0_9FLAO|nr:response regulator transcription factor [Flavivirga eckloniae]AUP77191.1 hypothetical protein C1H87_00035 [Flavivirga eckloniae]
MMEKPTFLILLSSLKNILLMEDYKIVAKYCKTFINTSSDFKVVGGYNNYEDAFKDIITFQPDFVLRDIILPGKYGIEEIKKVLKSKVHAIVALHENPQHVFDTLSSETLDYLSKRDSEKSLIASLYQSKDGGTPTCINIAKIAVESFREKRFDVLTDRENDVLTLLAEGKSYVDIGISLHLSINTIKFHLRNIYEKLNVSKKSEAIALFKNK